jgi:hypothetical protein
MGESVSATMPEMVTAPGEGQRKLAKQRPCQSALQADRGVHRRERNRHGDDRAYQLARPEQGRLVSAVSLSQVALDVLDDDNGVVHHQPDREHDGKQREQVECKSECVHEKDRPDEGNGYRDHRHQRRAYRAEEQEDDNYDDQQGIAQGFRDLADRIGDVFRSIIADAHLEARGHIALDGVELGAHAFDDIDGIGVRQRKDAHEDRRLAGITHRGFVVLRAKLHIGNILEAHDAVVVLVDHQAPELLNRVEIGIGGQRDLNQRTLCVADGSEEIVIGKRLPHLGGADVQCGHLVRLEPDAHGERARTEDFRALHPRNGRKPRLHDAREVVGDFRLREQVGRKAQIGGCELGVRGLHRDGGNFGLRRQIVADLIHLGRDLGQRFGRLVVQLQTGIDHRKALQAPRLDVVDAVGRSDGLLERCGNETAHQLGTRADVHGGDVDRRIFAARVLTDRERMPGLQARDDDEEIDDNGENGAVDKEIGERTHGAVLAGALVPH